MKTIIFAASALTLLAVAPASAQMAPSPVTTAGNVVGGTVNAAGTVATAPFRAFGGMMGGDAAGKSCVSGSQFVPCNQPMMNSGMGMRSGMNDRRMTRREMRAQRRMEQQQGAM